MASGTVKWFDPNRGYGFIQPEQGEDVFVHVTALEGSGMESLQEGQTVEFDIEQGERVFRQPTCGHLGPTRTPNRKGAVDGCDRGRCPPASLGMVGPDQPAGHPRKPSMFS
jgi:CspA family cold shock protein